MGVKGKHAVSDEFVLWLESAAGALTKMDAVYGGPSAMIEHPQWDESRTAYTHALVRDLAKHLTRVEKEIRDHVAGRPQ